MKILVPDFVAAAIIFQILITYILKSTRTERSSHSIDHYDPDIKELVKGVMVESYIEDGNQPVGGGCYGKSITDPCLGWDKTERLLKEVADLL